MENTNEFSMFEAMMEADPSLKPPKKWFSSMARKIKKDNPGYSDKKVKSTIGSIWYHKLGLAKKKEIRGREGKHYGPAEMHEQVLYMPIDEMSDEQLDALKADLVSADPGKDLAQYLDAIDAVADKHGVDPEELMIIVFGEDATAGGAGPGFGESPITDYRPTGNIEPNAALRWEGKHHGGAMIADSAKTPGLAGSI